MKRRLNHAALFSITFKTFKEKNNVLASEHFPPNVQQVDILIDLLLDLLILLLCEKFSFSEQVMMNALFFRRYVSYLNTFSMVHPTPFFQEWV